jgi:hypothetical protein
MSLFEKYAATEKEIAKYNRKKMLRMGSGHGNGGKCASGCGRKAAPGGSCETCVRAKAAKARKSMGGM